MNWVYQKRNAITAALFLLIFGLYSFLTYEHHRFKSTLEVLIDHANYSINVILLFDIKKNDPASRTLDISALNKRFFDEKWLLDQDAQKYGAERSVAGYFGDEYYQITQIAHHLAASMSYLGTREEFEANPTKRFTLSNVTTTHKQALTNLRDQSSQLIKRTPGPNIWQFITLFLSLTSVVFSIKPERRQLTSQ